jgi:hypothetical protein
MWMSPSMIADYRKFNDVVLIDSTFKTNRFGMPLVLLSGITNTGLNTIFGFALITDETCLSYEWVLQTLNTITKVFPKVIISDEDKAIIKAFKDTMPETKHTLCE